MLVRLLLLAMLRFPLTAEQTAAEQVNQAIRAMQGGNLTEARVTLSAALRQDPNNAEAQLQLGLLLGQLGDWAGAGEAFRRALHAHPELAEAHYNLGLTLVADPAGKRDWPGALLEFREAVRLRPGYASAHRLLGAGLSETGQKQEALAEFRLAVAQDAHSAQAHLDLGKALEETGDSAEADREYRECLRLQPGLADAEIALGKLLMHKGEAHKGEPGEAVQHLARALQLNPDNLAAQYSLARALQSAGRTADAQIAFRQAEALTRRDDAYVQSTRLTNQGLDAAQRGERETAVRLLKEAVAVRPDAALSHYNLGLVLADHGDWAQARSEMLEAISLKPAQAQFYLSFARLLKNLGEEQLSGAAWERARQLDPQNPKMPMVKPGVAPDSGQQKSYLKEHPFAFGAPFNTVDSHFAFATLLARQGNWDGAVGEWLHVLALDPANLDARNNLAVSYSHLGKDEEAELEFRKSLQVSADSAGAHFGLAVVALEKGHKTEAVEELQQVLRVEPDYPQAKSLLTKAKR